MNRLMNLYHQKTACPISQTLGFLAAEVIGTPRQCLITLAAPCDKYHHHRGSRSVIAHQRVMALTLLILRRLPAVVYSSVVASKAAKKCFKLRFAMLILELFCRASFLELLQRLYSFFGHCERVANYTAGCGHHSNTRVTRGYLSTHLHHTTISLFQCKGFYSGKTYAR